MRVQLKRNRSIRQALTAVTTALVGVAPANSAGLNHSETSVLIYSERDRIRATEAMFSVQKQMQNGDVLNLRFTYDGLTGASPTGASPSKQPQTLTRASGGSTVLVKAGELPIDNSFRETRFAFDADLTRGIVAGFTVGGGLHVSSEHDYKSIGLSASITKDLDSARTSIGLALSVLRDVNSPIGGIPTPFASTDAAPERENGRLVSHDNGHKNAYDAVLSLTRVLGPNLLARFSYNVNYAEGYLTDPYKVISVVQPPDSVDPGEPVLALYENRPGSRTANALSCDLRTFRLGMAIETEYRFFWDDWGIRSHTAYASVNLGLKRAGSIRPHLRWYRQSRANFSRPFLVQGVPMPEFVSADSRLAKFSAINAGLAYTVPTSPSSRLTFAIEWYTQRGDRSPPESFGPLLAFNLFPDLDAVMVRVGLSHDF